MFCYSFHLYETVFQPFWAKKGMLQFNPTLHSTMRNAWDPSLANTIVNCPHCLLLPPPPLKRPCCEFPPLFSPDPIHVTPTCLSIPELWSIEYLKKRQNLKNSQGSLQLNGAKVQLSVFDIFFPDIVKIKTTSFLYIFSDVEYIINLPLLAAKKDQSWSKEQLCGFL